MLYQIILVHFIKFIHFHILSLGLIVFVSIIDYYKIYKLFHKALL